MKIYWFVLFSMLLLSSCKRKWTDKDKSEFLSGCLSKAVIELGQDKAKAYCNCLLNKVVKKYPDANDAKYIRYDTSVRQLSRECLK